MWTRRLLTEIIQPADTRPLSDPPGLARRLRYVRRTATSVVDVWILTLTDSVPSDLGDVPSLVRARRATIRTHSASAIGASAARFTAYSRPASRLTPRTISFRMCSSMWTGILPEAVADGVVDTIEFDGRAIGRLFRTLQRTFLTWISISSDVSVRRLSSACVCWSCAMLTGYKWMAGRVGDAGVADQASHRIWSFVRVNQARLSTGLEHIGSQDVPTSASSSRRNSPSSAEARSARARASSPSDTSISTVPSPSSVRP